MQPPNHSVSAGPADAFVRLAAVIESRKRENGGDAQTSYVARLLQRGPDAFLKKIGEEACEVVLAAKDAEHGADSAALKARLVAETADLWFHCMIALAHFELSPTDVADELLRRAGTSGIEEKSLREARQRELNEGSHEPS